MVASSVTLPSYDSLKGTGMVILAMPSLRAVLSLNQMSDKVMTLIEGLWRLGDEIGVFNYLSWKLGYFHLSNAFRRDQINK